MSSVKPDEPTIGKLVADASRDVSALISQEIKLAKSELKVSVKAGGIGAGLLAAAAFVLVLVVILFSITAALLLSWDGDLMSPKWSFLIVTAFYVVVAAILALVGLRKVKQVKGPEHAIEQAKETKVALTKRG